MQRPLMLLAFRCWLVLAVSLTLAACEAPRSPGSLSLESRLRLAQAVGAGNPQQRLAVVREIARQGPDRSTLAEWANAAEQAGALAEATEALRALMAVEGPSEARLLAIGRLALRQGDAPGALEAFAQAVALAPRSATGFGGLGLAHDLAGDRAAAQAAYRRGIALAPTNWTLRSNLGVSLISAGAPRDAITVLSDAEILATAPEHARHNLALALAADGQPERAARLLRTSMGPTEALVMVQELTAFARWLEPPLVAVAPQQVAAPRPQASVAALPVVAAVMPVAPRSVIVDEVQPSRPRPADIIATAPHPSPVEGGPRVQLLAANSEAGARAAWAQLLARLPELEGRTPLITRFEREGHPTFWRLRTEGFEDAAEARAFCAQLRSRALACMPVGS